MNKSENKNQLETLQELAHIGLWEFNLTTQTDLSTLYRT